MQSKCTGSPCRLGCLVGTISEPRGSKTPNPPSTAKSRPVKFPSPIYPGKSSGLAEHEIDAHLLSLIAQRDRGVCVMVDTTNPGYCCHCGDGRDHAPLGVGTIAQTPVGKLRDRNRNQQPSPSLPREHRVTAASSSLYEGLLPYVYPERGLDPRIGSNPDGSTPGALQGDHPLEYYEDGLPKLPACLDRRKPTGERRAA